MAVVRMTKEHETNHINKLLDRLAKAQKLKAQVIAGEVTAINLNDVDVLVSDATSAYNYFKKEYGYEY